MVQYQMNAGEGMKVLNPRERVISLLIAAISRDVIFRNCFTE